MASRALLWLLALALVYTLYFAKTLLVPIVVALLLALLLSPLVAVFKRLYIPRTLSALLILGALGVPFTLLAIELAEPAQRWAKRIPEMSAHFTEQLSSLAEELDPEDEPPAAAVAVQPAPPEKKGFSFFGLFDKEQEPPPPPPTPVQEKEEKNVVTERIKQGGMEAVIAVLLATPVVIAQLMTCLILILFLLIFGPKLFNVAIDIFPQVKDKRRSVELVIAIRRQLSRYIVTVTIINIGLGLVTAGALWGLGVEDALLWGVLVGVLNFAPYVGPLIGLAILCLAGLVQYGPVLTALVPGLVYFSINLVEAQFVTPLVLGRHMQLNPLVLMIWLIIWGWLWGVSGVLLAVPLLVCIKLAAAQLHVLPHWVRLVETGA
ncbi:MAG: transporter [Gammaproteobacteria bacterium BRH_c0]|nr:MAG: transporter [Gammaproteobacteria bacterium BRH_c0]